MFRLRINAIFPPRGQTARRVRRRLRVRQRLLVAVAVIVALCLVGTTYLNFYEHNKQEKAVPTSSGWKGSVYGYVVADENAVTAQLYTEGLSVMKTCGRGTKLELESWTPYVAEDGMQYYHFFKDGEYGYILKTNISQDESDALDETTVYVRTTMNLLKDPDGIELGELVEKGTSLAVIGYDKIRDDGNVNMYEVKLGSEVGWIKSDYVSLDFVGAMQNWTNDDDVYETHVGRGDPYGGGNAADLDYWPREKGDFSAEGNVMPDSCYCLYIPVFSSCIKNIDEYLALAEGTKINTFVFTVEDDNNLAYPSEMLEQDGLLDSYNVQCSLADYTAAVQKVKDAGYYTVCRITAFKDSALAGAKPDLALCNLDGTPLGLSGTYWPSPYSRGVWQIKMGLALEAVEKFGFNEVMFDDVQFPYGIWDYEDKGAVDMQNDYNEEKAQTLQRFLTYASDVLHQHNTYLSTVVYGETAEPYVDSYGHYWPSVSTVADVICGTPYPDQFANYSTTTGYYCPFKHPYGVLSSWGSKVVWRQKECSSPAKVRTWIQTWNDTHYTYDAAAIQREILGLFDNNLTDGYMAWNYYGKLDQYKKMLDVFNTDYYSLWKQAQTEGVPLSSYMNVSTSDEVG
jgi:hypothetical protein